MAKRGIKPSINALSTIMFLTVLILVFGEISPKTIATYRAERLSLFVAPIIWFLMRVLTPLAAIVNFLASGVLKLSGVNRDNKTESYTENEIRSIVEVSTEEGVIEDEEKLIINNVFDFTDTIVREVMVPRVNITAVSTDSTFAQEKPLNFFASSVGVQSLENCLPWAYSSTSCLRSSSLGYGTDTRASKRPGRTPAESTPPPADSG